MRTSMTLYLWSSLAVTPLEKYHIEETNTGKKVVDTYYRLSR